MKGLRTLGVLVALLGGLAAYLYYVDAEKPVGETEEKPKVFAVEADQIEELKVSTIAGGVAELKKSADGWYLDRPAADPRRRLGGHRHHQQPGVGRDSTRRRREPGEPWRLRPARAGGGGELQGEGRQGVHDAADRDEDTDRQRLVREDSEGQEGVPRFRLPGVDVQPHAVRSARQEDHQLRSRQGGPHRDPARHLACQSGQGQGRVADERAGRRRAATLAPSRA